MFDNRYWIYPTYSAPYHVQVFMDAFSSGDLVTWTKHPRIIDTASVAWAKYALWATAIVKKGSRYFLFFAANDIQSDSAEGGIGVGVSDRPEGPWGGSGCRVACAIGDSLLGPLARLNTVLEQDPKIGKGAGHHSVIQIPGKDEWYIVYHRRPLDRADANHRVTFIDRMYFDDNGHIRPLKITVEGVQERKLR